MERYEVLTRFIFGWENCWSEDGERLTFATWAEAAEALRQHREDLLSAGMEYNPEDYLIEEAQA